MYNVNVSDNVYNNNPTLILGWFFQISHIQYEQCMYVYVYYV